MSQPGSFPERRAPLLEPGPRAPEAPGSAERWLERGVGIEGSASPRIREILRLAQPPTARFLPGLIWGVLSAGAAVALLAVSGWLIVSASIVDSLVPLSVAVVGVRFFAVSRAVFRYLERLSGHDAALRQLARTRSDMVRRLIPLSPAGLGRTDRGQVLSALIDDVENLQNLPLRVVQPLAVSAVVALGAVGFIAFVSPPAALALAGCLIVTAIVSVGLGWVFGSRAEERVSLARADVSASLVDYFGSLDVLLAYGAEAPARERIERADRVLRRTLTRASVAQAVAAGVVSTLAGVASVATLTVASPGLATGVIDGPWLAVVVLVPMVVFEVFGAVPIAAASWRSVRASARRIVDALPGELPDELRSDAGIAEPPASAALHLRNVHAAWPGGTPALRGVDLDLAAGERVLVSGPSGAGKSSLASVLVGFLRADVSRAGSEFTLGGADAASLSGPALREVIGLCEQHPQLFDEDIRQNLLFARDTATDDELFAVLERVGLGDWVRERGGLDARVGDRGALVSGGQAQRIALARAILRGFPVLVLDEPTAGVDPEASDALLRDMMSAAGEQSVVLISHVSPPAGTVDRVVRIDGGRTV
ncbi:thiol reductant ABC exporter subunit CydC [Microbacterium sp.]|uniref:thiol reductant ABC exporter subunit CydC n=1 Tax=Microbacterium sp. TaxID=51671 RepID=UPI002620E52A|nr:thiol reductant ABC exporter subunit CydC [Microbacterium sp.]